MGDDVGELGTILGVWAHPDDEAYLSGGLMALARDAGSRVVCVTATRGERGTDAPDRWPPGRLAAERTRELVRCLGILGVTEHHWLDYPDGGCAAVPAPTAVARIGAMIREVRPDTVLSFGPDGITGHADHRTVSEWTEAAFREFAPPGARLLCSAVPVPWAERWSGLHQLLNVFETGYPVAVAEDRLALDLVLDPQTLARKVRALAAQATQTARLMEVMGMETYTAWVSNESFVDRARQ